MFDQISEWPLLKDIDLSSLKKSITSSSLSRPNNFVSKFEDVFSQKHGAKYGVTVTNGSHALEIAYYAAGLMVGDEVLVPAFTFIAVASSLFERGIIPVPIDVDETFNINPALISENIGNKTRAILVVHISGFPSNINEILSISSEYGLVVIEDCAQAHGATYLKGDREVPVGSESDISIFSFQSAKVMSGGEGGIILTNKVDYYRKIMPFISYGRDYNDPNPYNHFSRGSNYRMTEMAAAILIPQLEKLEIYNKQRKFGLDFIQNELKNVKEIVFQKFPDFIGATTCSLFFFSVKGLERDVVSNRLLDVGFNVRPAYPLFYETPMLHGIETLGLTRNQMNNPVAQKISREFLVMPHIFLLNNKNILHEFCRELSRIAGSV